jgi:hypothetical protein
MYKMGLVLASWLVNNEFLASSAGPYGPNTSLADLCKWDE